MPVSPPSERDATLPESTRIVGLGASAGGLAVLEQFLAHVPSQSGLAYVVVQHLDPTHKAMLSELLQRATPMKVREVTDSLQVEADAVYVIPPDSELTLVGGKLHLTKPVQPRGQRLPIDVLFASLARAQGERSIGVVLSGMGSDGTLGLLEIKSQGGLTLAQQPESAQFDSMPRSAIAAGCVDIVALPADMPERILKVAGIRHEPSGRTSEPAAEDGSQPLPAILDLVRARSKHDLSSYKSSTLLRRIERRVAVHGLASVAAYEAFLRENPHEIDLLFAEILIGVTGFFRDPAVWKELKENILPEFLARRPAGARLRAWVVGCSTGEEAYSLAMLFDEVCAGASHGMIQIFATDLSLDGIAAARRGLYPAILTREMEPERVARFFSKRGADLLVDKRIREMVLFAQHDVILDPPFTKLDLLLCRNLLIYFNAALQRRLMPLFHYSLKPGGVLVLGSAETVGRAQALFSPISPKSRIYRRKDYAATAALVDFPINRLQFSRPSAKESALDHPSSAIDNLQFLADQILLKEFAPPAVLVNERGDIVYISGRTGRYLEPAAGKANWNIHVMARPGIRTQLAVALRQALQDKKSVELNDLRIEEDPGRPVHIMVEAIQEPKALAGMVMIVFREAPEAAPGKSPRRRQARGGDPTLAAELERSREEIRALRQEMSASSEELQATNEELQSTNEELQSANEELTTSKEEAQSMNEELQTINGELQSKLDDLALAQSDMQNLLNSTNIATLFLDSELHVRRFTDKAIDIFHLREGDVGRPLSDLASMLIYPELHADAKETLRTLVPSEKEVATTEGRWYSVRIMPYRTLANVIQGAVITFFDISAAKELESRLRKV